MPPVTDYAALGPFEAEVTANAATGFTIARPTELGKYCMTHPVITWGNATGIPVGAYNGMYELWASHGFVVIASNSITTGQGAVLIEGLDVLEGLNSDSSSEFFGMLDINNAGTSGHSQGGGSAAFVAGSDPRIKAAAPIMPDCNFWVRCTNSANITAATFAIAGGGDTLVPASSVKRNVYDPIGSAPAIYALRVGLDHVSWMSSGDTILGPEINAWFRAFLLDDKDALEMFSGACTLCSSSDWDLDIKNL